jgi:hypothetical protein
MLLEQEGERVTFFAAAAAGGWGGLQRCALGAWCAYEGVGQSKRRCCDNRRLALNYRASWLAVGV